MLKLGHSLLTVTLLGKIFICELQLTQFEENASELS
ncbi:hypothetical protein OROHE_000453 [Orobanche hederae]